MPHNPIHWLQNGWQKYTSYIKKHDQQQTDRQYLPAVIELQENPPSRTIRLFLIGICVFISLTFAWAILGKMDIIAVGQGKIIPSGRVKLIQPLETGKIRKIFVHEGEVVTQGDPLVQLDTTLTEADQEKARNDLMIAQASIQRLTALLEGTPVKFESTTPQEIKQNQTNLLEQAQSEYKATIANLTQQKFQKEHELSGIKETIKKLKQTIPLITERTKSYEKLAKQHYVARTQYLQLEEQRINQVYELETQRQHQKELKAALQAITEQIHTTEATFKRTTLTELNETTQKRMELEQDLTKAEQRNQFQLLSSPIDGTVQELKVHTIGGVVTPAQELMKIVPHQDAMEAEIFIQNKDIGFVHEGQSVRLKLEAYPFTKYGLVEGIVKKLSLDAIQDENLGLVYSLIIAIHTPLIHVEDKDILLTPGLAVTGEIKTGARRIIEYFLSPIMKHTSEAIKER